VNANEKLIEAIERHRKAVTDVDTKQRELGCARKERDTSEVELIRIINALGKAGESVIYCGRVFRVVATESGRPDELEDEVFNGIVLR
jgi:hypothetical protein